MFVSTELFASACCLTDVQFRWAIHPIKLLPKLWQETRVHSKWHNENNISIYTSKSWHRNICGRSPIIYFTTRSERAIWNSNDWLAPRRQQVRMQVRAQQGNRLRVALNLLRIAQINKFSAQPNEIDRRVTNTLRNLGYVNTQSAAMSAVSDKCHLVAQRLSRVWQVATVCVSTAAAVTGRCVTCIAAECLGIWRSRLRVTEARLPRRRRRKPRVVNTPDMP